MRARYLAGKPVSEIGLGCMNLSHAYGAPLSREDGVRLIHAALDLGVTHFDTAALYGFGANEELVGGALKGARDRVFIASKCGMRGVDGKRVIDGRPRALWETLDASLQRLGTTHIDLYYLHRWDKNVPIEESVGALSRMVEAGKIGAIGLSEVSASTLRKAHATHPIAALQSEYSLLTRNAELAVLEETARIGAAFVAFSPLGRGLLTDRDVDPSTFMERDIRRPMPRFQKDALERNQALIEEMRAISAQLGCKPGQLALAWLLRQGPHVHVIPGTTDVGHLVENVGAGALSIPADVLETLSALFAPTRIAGARYPALQQSEIDTEEFSDASTSGDNAR